MRSSFSGKLPAPLSPEAGPARYRNRKSKGWDIFNTLVLLGTPARKVYIISYFFVFRLEFVNLM